MKSLLEITKSALYMNRMFCRSLWGYFAYIANQHMQYHDVVIKWKPFPRYWPFVRGIHRSPVNSPHKGQWGRALMFSLICVWVNGWVNNREAGNLRRYRAHYDVIVMIELTIMPHKIFPWNNEAYVIVIFNGYIEYHCCERTRWKYVITFIDNTAVMEIYMHIFVCLLMYDKDHTWFIRLTSIDDLIIWCLLKSTILCVWPNNPHFYAIILDNGVTW